MGKTRRFSLTLFVPFCRVFSDTLERINAHFPSDVVYALFYARIPSDGVKRGVPMPANQAEISSGEKSLGGTEEKTLQKVPETTRVPEALKQLVARDNARYRQTRSAVVRGAGGGQHGNFGSFGNYGKYAKFAKYRVPGPAVGGYHAEISKLEYTDPDQE